MAGKKNQPTLAGLEVEPIKAKQRKRKSTGFEDTAPAVFRRNTFRGRVIRKEISARFASQAIGPIEKGVELYALTMGKFSLVDVIEHALDFTGPADVTVSTWTAAGADITFARRLLTDGRIRSLRFVVDYSFVSRDPGLVEALREAFGDEAIRITKNHAKFVTIKNDEWDLVIRTSMNLNECRRLETIELSDDPAMMEFLQSILEQLFANQPAGEGFARRPYENCVRFGEEWGDAVGDDVGVTEKRHFGDGPTSVDLRRAGLSRRC